jgi:hypothetical protein
VQEHPQKTNSSSIRSSDAAGKGKTPAGLDAARRLREAGAVAAFREVPMADKDYTPYQQKIIKRYYNNLDALSRQRLAELVGDLYLAEGKKKKKLWEAAAAAMQKLGVPQSRIDHLVAQQNPALLAELVKELEKK